MTTVMVIHFVCYVFLYVVECVRNVVAHGDAREGKWRGNGEWSLYSHTTSERGVSSIT